MRAKGNVELNSSSSQWGSRMSQERKGKVLTFVNIINDCCACFCLLSTYLSLEIFCMLIDVLPGSEERGWNELDEHRPKTQRSDGEMRWTEDGKTKRWEWIRTFRRGWRWASKSKRRGRHCAGPFSSRPERQRPPAGR